MPSSLVCSEVMTLYASLLIGEPTPSVVGVRCDTAMGCPPVGRGMHATHRARLDAIFVLLPADDVGISCAVFGHSALRALTSGAASTSLDWDGEVEHGTVGARLLDPDPAV